MKACANKAGATRYLLSLLGIRQVIVVVNKMDLVGLHRGHVFDEIEEEYRAFLAQLGLEARVFHSSFGASRARTSQRRARANEVVSTGRRCSRRSIDLEPPTAPADLPLRFCVQDVYRFDERRIIAGRIETGTLRVGDSLVFSPANKTSSVVATIERWNAPPT